MRISWILTVTLLLGISLFSAPVGGRELDIGGNLELEYQLFTETSPYPSELHHALRLDLTSFTMDSNLFVVLLLQEDGYRLGEAFAELFTEATDWRVGRQIVPWGMMDGASPTDTINPVDYTRPFAQDNRLEVSAVRAQHYAGDWELDAVWIPLFTHHVFPAPLGELETPDTTLEHSEVGLRVSRWLPGMDIAVSYLYGWDRTPFQLQRQHVIGGGMNKDFGSFVARAEAAYFLPEEADSFLQYALGFDTNITDDLYLIAQFNGTTGQEEDQQTISLSATYELNFQLKAQLNGVYAFHDESFLLQPSITWDVADNYEIAAGMMYLDGDEGTSFGGLQHHQRLFLRVTRAF